MNNSSKSANAANSNKPAQMASQVVERVQHVADDYGVTKAYYQVEGMVENRPLSSVMISFGIGMGVGLALGSMLAAATYTEPKTRTAERMGQQLLDALSRVVPSSISDRFHS